MNKDLCIDELEDQLTKAVKALYVNHLRIDELEAKLAKSVGALNEIAGKPDFADDPWTIARTALVDLKEN